MPVFTAIDAVLFDLGGTLLDYPIPSWPVMVGQCARGAYGYLTKPERDLPPPATKIPDPSEARARRKRVPPDSALAHRAMMALRRMVRSLSGRTLPRVAEACARPLVAEGHVFDDTLPALRTLRDRGYRLGLISNTPWGTPDYLWTGQLERFGLAAYFEVALFSSDVGFRKPDGRIFRMALQRLGLAPERVVFVGDNPVADVLGAQRAGLASVLIVRPGCLSSGVSPVPDLRIESLAELPGHLPGPKTVDGSRPAP